MHPRRSYSHRLPSALCFLSLALAVGVPLARAGKCPNAQFVFDLSASMTSPLGATSRVAVAKAAVTDAVTSYAGKLPLGLTFFPQPGACGARLAAAPALTSGSTIKSALAAANADGSSALGDGLTLTMGIAELKDPAREQHVIVITDGPSNCGVDQPQTLSLVQQARMRSPLITTHFLVFDADLTAADKTYMTSLAVAGGAPDPGATKYTPVVSDTQLKLAVQTLVSGLLVGCDESCYVSGCKLISETCIRGECKVNPCAGVGCPSDQYCYTDGESAGTCVHQCTSTCASGTRCRGGDCIPAPCGVACGAGTVCNVGTHHCDPDPLCSGVTCAGSSACVAGICVDDPCRLIRCPGGTRCVPWEGSCEHVGGEVPDGGIPDGGNATPDLSGPEGLRDGGLTVAPDLWGFSAPGAGCETAPGPAQASSTVALAAFGLALALGLLWRRTRGNRATAA